MKQPIELRRLRDFGQIITDSFTFIKENFRPLFKALLIICGFFILIGAVSTVFTYMSIMSPLMVNIDQYRVAANPVAFVISAFFNALILVLTQVFIYLVTFCYISVYIQKKNNTPTLAEVWGYCRYYFFRILGSGILIFLLLIAGFILCIIPGIYLSPITSLIIPIIVIENASFGYAFNKSFRLIKSNWWLVFGVLFIMSLIVGVGSSVVSIPLSIITVSGKFLSLKSFTFPLLIIFSFLRSLLMLAYVLPAVGICLCYFTLAEEKDGTGLLDRIGKLGENNDDQQGLPAEEY